MIKAIIFDWGGVLIQDPTSEYIQYYALYFHTSEQEFRSAYTQYNLDFQKGLLSEDEFWSKVCTNLGVRKPPEYLWRQIFTKSYHENNDVFSLASDLKNNGYRIGLLSNTELPATEFFYEQSYSMFDDIVFSCEEHLLKPDKKIYELMVSRLEMKPCECVFIDDRNENINAAVEIGLYGILFVTRKQCINELQKLGVACHKR